MRSYAHLPTRPSWDRFSSLERVSKLDQTAGDPARDRSGGQLERFSDRAIGLVAGEEAVEDLAAVLGQCRHRVVDVERLVDPRQRVFVGIGCLFGLVSCLFSRAGAKAVDADASGELGEPGLDRLVVAKRVEPLVDLGEDLLEDVLGVVLGEPKALRRDRVDISGEPLDESGPRVLVAFAATGDKLRSRNRLRQGSGPRRVWRNRVCVPRPRCSPHGSVLGRANSFGY